LDEHLVDSTLIEAWARHRGFKRKAADQNPPDGNPSMEFHGKRRTNATHQATIEPEARLARKEAQALLAGALRSLLAQLRQFEG
jgi:hypothetical protein